MSHMAVLRYALLLPLVLACRPERGPPAKRVEQADLAARQSRMEQMLADSTTRRDTPIARWVLPDNLAEVSGLALTSDGRLLAHDDERGRISVIDYRTGIVTKQFVLGRRGVSADFEGIAVAGRDIFMLTSTGKIYAFLEGTNRGHVDHSVHDTELGRECEFEGLAYAEAIQSLLLACKNVGEKDLKDHLVIFRWKIDPRAKPRISHLAIPLSAIIEGHDWKDFHPSGIEVDPITGNYVLIASQENALVAITPEGRSIFARSLPEGHDQAEGITITGDSLLIIADEAEQQPATITVYRWP